MCVWILYIHKESDCLPTTNFMFVLAYLTHKVIQFYLIFQFIWIHGSFSERVNKVLMILWELSFMVFLHCKRFKVMFCVFLHYGRLQARLMESRDLGFYLGRAVASDLKLAIYWLFGPVISATSNVCKQRLCLNSGVESQGAFIGWLRYCTTTRLS